MTNGRILYEGPSQFDGRPIVAVATNLGRVSKNTKTADCVQVFILPRDVRPTAALRTGEDASVCGGCKHRPKRSGGMGTCYVEVGRSVTSVWDTYRAGRYRPFDPADRLDIKRAADKPWRLGAWGDPAAVPFDVWEPCVALAPGHMGYTHAWLTCDPLFKTIVMASCDTAVEALLARARGWRPFRVRRRGEALLAGEFKCPASEEAGKRLTCAECLACWGADDVTTRAFPGLEVHGPPNKMVAFNASMEAAAC